tara:strand:- start:5507 stop:5914 length:408 start_codon:yes stop_codon:yes gene_type:complete
MKLLILISFSILTSGCSTLSGMFTENIPEVKPIEIVTIQKPAPLYHPPLPESVIPAEIKWKILNPENMREYITEYDSGEAPAVAYYSLTSQGYENLSNNISDIKRYIRQNLAIIKYYRDNDPTKKVDKNGSKKTN